MRVNAICLARRSANKSARHSLSEFCSQTLRGSLVVAVVQAFGLVPIFAQPWNPGQTESEQWVWSEIRAGQEANLNRRCGTSDLDPGANGDARWDDGCRAISATFIKKILTSKPWRDELPRRLSVVGGRVKDPLDLSDESIGASVVLRNSKFDAPVSFSRAHFAALLDLSGSHFAHGISANSINVESDFFLRDGAVVRGGVLNLVAARVTGDISLRNSFLEGGLEADSLQANRLLLNRTTVRGGPVRFLSAEVKGNLVLRGALLEPEKTDSSPEELVNFDGVKIAKNLDLRGASVKKGSVWLTGAEIKGNVELEGSTLTGFTVDNAKVDGNLLVRSVILASAPRVDASDIKGNVDISQSKLPGLDLVNTNIGGVLRLGSDIRQPPQWQKDAFLNLNGTRTKVLQDRMGSNNCELGDSWPSKLNLQSFTYDQLGARPGHDLRTRDACWYSNWLERDPYFSRQPYQQLARVLQTQGDPDRANAVRYAARDREWREAWQKGDYGSSALLGLLKITIGYGIGEYTFRVLWWIGGLALAGMLVLVFSPKAKEGKRADWKATPHFELVWPIWCFGASLDQLLPIVELNKEFSDFFNDPHRQRLNNLQHLYFGMQALTGYLLGVALVAALSGVTQAS